MEGFKPKVPDMTPEEKKKLINNPENQAAQDEANMLRAQMGQSPTEGTVLKSFDGATMYSDRVMRPAMPTKEDYESAAKVLDEMKEMVKREPNFEKFLNQVGRFFNNFGDILGGAWFMTNPGALGVMKDQYDRRLAELTDAAYKLNQLKKAGKDFGKEQARAEELFKEMRDAA